MDRRIPSTSSAVGHLHRSNVRHRSGAFDSKASSRHIQDGDMRLAIKRDGSASEHSDRTLTVQVQDTDDADQSTPTVLLVRRSRISARSTRSRYKPLPGVPVDPHRYDREQLSPSSHHSPLHTGRDTPIIHGSDLHGAFSHVPLTPPPPRIQRRPSDNTVHTAVSARSSRLPTPDYSVAGGGDASRERASYFARIPILGTSRPAPPRTESEGSTYSHVSFESKTIPHLRTQAAFDEREEAMRVPTAIKDKRPLLLSMFNTKDKFTHKFPRPRSIKGSSFSGTSVSAPDEDYGLGIERVERWTPHKWWLVVSVCTVLVYGTGGLLCALLTWFRAWQYADLMYVADYDILILITLASSILILTALVGLSGALLNSRPLLAVYALLLWPAFFSMLAIGYPAYKRYAFALDRKLSRAWSEWYTPLGRRVIQDALRCCGFLTPAHDAAPSARCFPRSSLPGCKGALWLAERESLATVWRAVFALVPAHIANIVVALLCANHVTRTFGKGIMPRRYRLNAEDIRADAAVLVKVLGGAQGLAVPRPGYARASSSGAFREDKHDGRMRGVDAVGLGIFRP